LGHLERMEDDRMPKTKGRREEVERNLQVLEVRRWREFFTDRTKSRDIVRQAEAHNGL